MTPRTIVFVAARLLAVWCVVSSVSTLASAPAMNWDVGVEGRIAQGFAVASLTIMPLLCAVAMWFGSAWLANRVSTDAASSFPHPVAADPTPAARWLFNVGVSLLGVVVIANVLPELASAVAFGVAAFFAPPTADPIDTTLQYERWLYQQAGVARLVGLFTRLGVGVILLVGPRYVWREARAHLQRIFRSNVRHDDPE